MKVVSVSSCPYEDEKGEVLNLHVELSENETITVGQTIRIEMMDDSVHQTEVKIIDPQHIGDYKYVSSKVASLVALNKCSISENKKQTITGPCTADLVVMNVPYHEVKTDEEIATRRMISEMREKVCISPYKELKCGSESIYDYVQKDYKVPAQVIAYLRTTEPYLLSPGSYTNPFNPETHLFGPYLFTDGHYYWERNTWKYVLKYHVKLPQEFVNHAMSDEGAEFIRQWIDHSDQWSDSIKKLKKKQGFASFVPNNDSNELKNF